MNKRIEIVAQEVLDIIDRWTIVMDNGAVKIRNGHMYDLMQAINRLLRECWVEYERTNSCDLEDILRLIVSNALGQDFKQYQFLITKLRNQRTFPQLPIAYLEDSRNTCALKALQKAMGMLGARKPAETEQNTTSAKRWWMRIWIWAKRHPHSYGLMSGFIFLILFFVLGLFKAQWRNWCWGTAGLAFLVLILSLLGGRSR